MFCIHCYIIIDVGDRTKLYWLTSGIRVNLYHRLAAK